jgi:predicted PP-loop superfamily ATPase
MEVENSINFVAENVKKAINHTNVSVKILERLSNLRTIQKEYKLGLEVTDLCIKWTKYFYKDSIENLK